MQVRSLFGALVLSATSLAACVDDAVPQTTAPQVVKCMPDCFSVLPVPAYPTLSRQKGEQGTVLLLVLLDSAGRQKQLTIESSSGYPALDQAALAAARAARFHPYLINGKAQPVWISIPIKFVLSDFTLNSYR